MFWKSFLGMCGLGVPVAYFLGAFGGAGYDRVVSASPDKVRSALMDLDIRNAPGEPGSDPSASGGVAPLFQLTEQGNDMVWTVMSGKDVAVRMIAHLEPLEGGTKTRVTAQVQRGNAPDDVVSPAFRSTGTTLGLFGLVLEDELDALTRPAGLSPQECQELAEKLFEANSFAINEAHTGGIAGAAKASMTMNAIDQKLKSKGCDTSFKKFDDMPAPQMTEGSDSAVAPSALPQEDIQYGKPTMDLSQSR